MSFCFRESVGRRTPHLRPCRCFAFCDTGGAAVEFALIAPAFLALLAALFQTVLVFFAGRVLDETTEQASRYILTGQAQKSNMSQADFATWVCGKTFALFNCNNFMINAQSYSDFGSANTDVPTITFDKNGQISNTWNWSLGSSGDIVVVQVMYPWPVVGGPLGFNLSNLANGQRLLVSTAVFRTEPY